MPDIFIPSSKPASNALPTKKPLPTAMEKAGRMGMLATFCINPVGVTFATQEADETILLFLRRHFITNFPWIFSTIVLFLIPPILQILAQAGITILPFPPLPFKFVFVFFLLYYLIVFGFAFINFITWFYNISLITTKRIVDIDYSDIVYRNVAVTKLELIEDVNYIQTGVIRSLFNYGDVFAQTAGEREHFDFLAVPKPAEVVHIVQDLIGEKK